MKEATHVFHHQPSGNWLELTLNEATGGYKLQLTQPVCADDDFFRDLRRWIRQIGRGWQKRHGEQTVSVNFSTSKTK